MKPKHVVLREAAVRRLVEPVLPRLREADRARLVALLPLFRDGEANLGLCLKEAFPRSATANALAAFRVLRAQVNAAFTRAQAPIRFAADRKTRTGPEGRACWFEGEDTTEREIVEFAEAAIADISRAEQRGQLVRQTARTTTGRAEASDRRPVRFFVSYSHDDEAEARQLVADLQTQFGPSLKYEFKPWGDWYILSGERWREEIATALGACDFGLLLVSPSFLGSPFILEEELPCFVEGTKPMVPVGLVEVDFLRHGLKGLEERQIFRHRPRPTRDSKWYGALRDRKQRREFAQALYKVIEERLDRLRALPAGVPATPETQLGQGGNEGELDRLADDLSRGEAPPHFTPTRGHVTRLRAQAQPGGQQPDSAPAADAVSILEEWATDPESAPYYALLGEYGIGKTTTLKQLTRQLLKRRRKDRSLPLPIFIDLRLYNPRGDGEKQVPSLEALLELVIRKQWKQGGRSPLTPDEILTAVREQGALLIFDGLDEKIVHLTPERAREFVRELWKALPISEKKDARGGKTKRRGKLILSCRSHYFKDVWSQNALLTGEDREGIEADDYQACILLPFQEDQIREYLAAVLGPARLQSAWELIRSVHNLSELSQRPYLLSLVAEHVGELEGKRAAGETILGVSLYEMVAMRWLGRDDGKHHFSENHKLRLMEALAAAMWRDGAREWPWSKVEHWLDTFLHIHPQLADRYRGTEPEVLNEDLRTATFILRPDDKRQEFCFAHTSLQEYFIACYLLRALDEGALHEWDMDLPSLETLVFLGQRMSLDADARRVRALEQILAASPARARRLALSYWLLAEERNWPAPAPVAPDLSGLDLGGWEVHGTPGRRLDLRGADLTGACLDHASVRRVVLSGAEMRRASARCSVWEEVGLSGVRLDDADLTGAVFRRCEAVSLQGARARWHDAHWILSDMSSADLGANFERDGTLAACRPGPERAGAAVTWKVTETQAAMQGGHHKPVMCSGWSPDGKRILSGSYDNTLRVWDGESGRVLLTLEGHKEGVLACAWSPDGKRILSGSKDNTLRVWDGESGGVLLTLEGHKEGVGACAWSPDGKRILSGSDDSTLRVWDGESGRALVTLEGHRARVKGCAWSPDGKRIVSGSNDSTLRVWDAESGRVLLTIEGHKEAVLACAWSPDGRRLVSSSKTLQVWDGESGRTLLTLEGHRAWVRACAWSPDGKRIVSCSNDSTLRVWDGESGRTLLTLEGHRAWVGACAWSPDGKRIVSCSNDSTLRVWDGESGRTLLTLEGHRAWVLACAWSPDGKRIVSGSTDNRLRVWDGEGGRVLLTLEGHKEVVLACAWSPDGRRILSGSNDNTLRVWDGESGRALLTLRGHRARVRACAWSPDGKRVLSGSQDSTLRVWDAESGRALLALEGHKEGVLACAWSPDGKRIVSGSNDTTLRVWDGESGRMLLTLEGHKDAVLTCAWSPDGRRLLSGSRTLQVWDAESGGVLLTLEGHRAWVRACAWSPDGKRILSGSHDNTLQVWDGESGGVVLTLEGHKEGVGACAWSPDGKRILSGSNDSTLRLWDAENGQGIWVGALLPRHEAASLDVGSQRFLWVSPGAWRYLAWRVPASVAGRVRILPAEYFGPLPA